jgi:signal transduction histidine kinase
MGVQERVRQHRGQYQLDSGPDGSTVTVTLFDEVTP